MSSVHFLGFIIEQGRLKADPEKIQAVVDWLVPTNQKQLQKFLGFANFYRPFVRNYSRIAAPLTQLTSSKLDFAWSPAVQIAFINLKSLFSSASVLIHPDAERQFIVEVDASDWGPSSPSAQSLTRGSTPVPSSPGS